MIGELNDTSYIWVPISEESHLDSASFLSIDDRQEHGTVMA